MRAPISPSRIEVVDDQVAEVLRRQGGAASVEMIAAAWRFMRSTLREQVARRHPTWDDAAIDAEVSRSLVCGVT